MNNRQATNSRPNIIDPLDAVEPETLDKRRDVRQDDDREYLGVRDEVRAAMEEPMAVAIDDRGRHNADVLAGQNQDKDKHHKRSHDEPLDAVDSAVFMDKMRDEEPVVAEQLNANDEAVEEPVQAEVNKEEEPVSAVEENPFASKVQVDSPVQKLNVRASKIGKVPPPNFEDDYTPALEREIANAAERKDEHSVSEDPIDAAVFSRKMEDDAILDKKTSVKKNPEASSHAQAREEGKEFNAANMQAPVIPALAKNAARHKDESKPEDDPINAVDPQVLDKKEHDYLKGVAAAEPRRAGEEKKEDSDDEPLDAVETNVLTSKMPNDPLGKSKTMQAKKRNMKEDDILLSEKTKRIPEDDKAVPVEAPKSGSSEVSARNKENTSAANRNIASKREVSDAMIIPIPTAAADHKHEDETPLNEDPLDSVDPKVFSSKMADSPAERGRREAKFEFKEPAANEPRAIEDEDAGEGVEARMRFGEHSEALEDPLEAVDAKVFDKAPNSKRSPLEILRSFGYDATKYNLDEVIEVAGPAQSFDYLGNVKLSHIDSNIRGPKMIEGN
eukprot:TRINITY_DN8992_c0_g2_i3.p1 TRINITY_DN8992_c0_g2~~TRINITY_DN8992_c0_g2_i3.p1  ORF type:complete len:558 (+),score=133.79 TRINITY_DN8992_c0_g2_i3:416-2089(+)